MLKLFFVIVERTSVNKPLLKLGVLHDRKKIFFKIAFGYLPAIYSF